MGDISEKRLKAFTSIICIRKRDMILILYFYRMVAKRTSKPGVYLLPSRL